MELFRVIDKSYPIDNCIIHLTTIEATLTNPILLIHVSHDIDATRNYGIISHRFDYKYRK